MAPPCAVASVSVGDVAVFADSVHPDVAVNIECSKYSAPPYAHPPTDRAVLFDRVVDDMMKKDDETYTAPP